MKISKILLAGTLIGTITIAGCSVAWINTLDAVLQAAAPALINILNIISISKGEPLNTELAAKINADSTTVKTLANDFAVASAATAPQACSQLQAAISVYSADQAQVLQLASVQNSAVQAKVITLSALVSGTVEAITAVIPSCKQAVGVTYGSRLFAGKAVPLPLKSFVKSYNTNLAVPTGVAAVDSYTKGHKVHLHSKILRVVTFGKIS